MRRDLMVAVPLLAVATSACAHLVQPQTWTSNARTIALQQDEYLAKELVRGLPEAVFARWYAPGTAETDPLRPVIRARDVERAWARFGLTPSVSAAASRVSVPVYRGGRQIGKATSTTWSPSLKKMIALASVEAASAAIGTALQMEITVEATRQKAGAQVVSLPFFNPPRKTAVPAA